VNPQRPDIAVIGGGQLARMMQQAAIGLGVRLRLLAEGEDASAAQVIPDHIVGDHTSMDDLRAAARDARVVTFDHEHVPPSHLEPVQPVVRLLRGQLAGESGDPDPPHGNLDAELVPELQRASEEPRRLLVAPQVRMHGAIHAEIAEPPDALGGARILEQRDELVAQP
jgi:hypothetical protein